MTDRRLDALRAAIDMLHGGDGAGVQLARDIGDSLGLDDAVDGRVRWRPEGRRQAPEEARAARCAAYESAIRDAVARHGLIGHYALSRSSCSVESADSPDDAAADGGRRRGAGGRDAASTEWRAGGTDAGRGS